MSDALRSRERVLAAAKAAEAQRSAFFRICHDHRAQLPTEVEAAYAAYLKSVADLAAAADSHNRLTGERVEIRL